MAQEITLRINGKEHTVQVDEDVPLLWVIREHLQIIGTKYGCGISQCGYCQPGQIMQAVALLQKNSNPSEEEIVRAMEGNLCRCGTYTRIKRAIKLAAREVRNS